MNSEPLPAVMQQIAITAAGGPEVLVLQQVPLPQPAPDELLIRVAAAGVNRPDVLQRLGKYPLPAGVNPIPGLEVAGEVAMVGSAVHNFALGDKVCALTNGGGYAEYCVAPAGQTLPVPAGIKAEQAAAIPETFFTVWANLFTLGHATRGACVLIHGGTSGIGTTALLLCRERGIQAFATAGSAAKCAAIRALGAVAINYREQDFVDVLHAATAGRGADVILDIMGASYFQRNLQALARGGRLVNIGLLGGAVVERVDLAAIMAKGAIVTGSMMRSRSAAEKAAIAAELHRQVWPALTAGRCLPMIDKTFPLADAAAAHRSMEEGQHIGKIVLTMPIYTGAEWTC